jgi:hypothetical protein
VVFVPLIPIGPTVLSEPVLPQNTVLIICYQIVNNGASYIQCCHLISKTPHYPHYETIYQVEVTDFVVEASQIETPILAGFISPGIDKDVSNIANAVLKMYKPSLIKVIPNIFQKLLKKTVNILVLDYFASDNTFCPKREFPTNNTFINLDDLLLSEEDAVVVGGSGLSPYGHIFCDVMSFTQVEFVRTNQHDGISYLNELLI